MRTKIWLVLAVSAVVAGSSVLIVGPASAQVMGATVDVNIEKQVVGDDPGVAFPIELTCTSITEVGLESDIELGQNDIESFTVELKDGETETVTVDLPDLVIPDLVTCEVTENLKDAGLPAGWVCESEITPDEFTLWDASEVISGGAGALGGYGDIDEVDVTVVNDCTKPVVTTTTTTAPTIVVVQPKFTG